MIKKHFNPYTCLNAMASSISRALILMLPLIIISTGATASMPESNTVEGANFHVTPIYALLFNDDHNSEGFLAPLDNGNLLLIFRIDPGTEGNHVGTGGYIAKITYYPEEDRWGEPETVYNSNRFDDRNIHGGVTREGRIVIFFRHLAENAEGRHTEGRYFMYSDDNGKTWTGPLRSPVWSDPHKPDMRFGVWGTGHMFYNGDIDRYSMPGYGRHLLYITYCRDGSVWDEINIIKEDNEVALTEIAGAWTGNNRVIALIRDDARSAGHPLLQVESLDNGKTWSEPIPANIPFSGHWGAAPQLIYDQERDLLIALTSDRYTRDHSENSLFLYSAHPGDIFGNPQNWTLEYELQRPWSTAEYKDKRPVNQSFYGYPTIAKINEKEYLVVFTERARMENAEQADLYYFRIMFD